MSEQHPDHATGEGAPPAPGSQFGKYELLSRIGSGGMAEIYKARVTGPHEFEKLLVVKKILPAFARNRAFVRMLIAEAKVSSLLQHANIVQIYELGEIEGQYYIAMEYVDGADLLRILTQCTRRNQRVPTELVLYIVSEVCKGLAYAHAATDSRGRPLHVIHRDVSPSNVLVSYEGEVKIMDFGVARADVERASQSNQGQAGRTLKGKLGYMSPEQVQGHPIDHRSDIFSLGVVLFEALTLKRLFVGRTDTETLLNIRDARIEPKLQRHRYIPEGIQAILRRALAPDPRDRYRTATDFQEAILDYLFENRLRVSSRTMARFLRETIPPARPGPEWAAEEAAEPEPAPVGEPTPTARPQPVPDSRSSPETSRQLESTKPFRTRPLKRELEPETGATPRTREEGPEDAALPREELEGASFRIRQPDGSIFGPISYKNLLRLLRSRSVTSDEAVSIDGGPWRSLDELEGLREEATGLRVRQTPATEEGPISRILLPRLLYRVAIERFTGGLRLSDQGRFKQILFQNGLPVQISSNDKEELLGAFLQRRNLLGREQLERAVEATRDDGARLGDTMVRQGVLEPHGLFRILELQFRERFLEVFRWERGWYELLSDRVPREEPVWMGYDTVQLLTAGVRTQFDLAAMEVIFADYMDQEIILERNPHITHNNLRLNSRELRFYASLEHGASVRRTLERRGRSDEDRLTLLQVIFLLHRTDLLSLRAPEPVG